MKAIKIIMIAVALSALAVSCPAQFYTVGQVQSEGAAVATANATGMLNASAVMEANQAVNVSIVNVNYLGDEWVAIANQGAADVNLAGWTLADESGELRYVFPAMILPAGSLVRIHPGHGIETAGDIYIGLPGDMLDDTGDMIALLDASGTVVSRYTYPGVAFTPIEPAVPGLVQTTPLGVPVVGVTPTPVVGVAPDSQVQRGVLVEPGDVAQPFQGEQIVQNATSIYVTELANVPVIFETNEAINANITGASFTGDEWIDLVNEGLVSMDLTGWTLMNAENATYTFPARVLPPGQGLRVHTGQGISTPAEIYMNQTAFQLNDAGDVITLMDATGTVVSRYTYPASAFTPLEPAVPGLVRSPGTAPVLLTQPGAEISPLAAGVDASTTGASPSGAAFLGAPVPALPAGTTTTGQVQQTIVGPPGGEIIGEPIAGTPIIAA